MKKFIKTKIIQDYVRENNLTLEEFCNACGMSPAHFAKLLIYGSDSKSTDIFVIAGVLNISVFDLVE